MAKYWYAICVCLFVWLFAGCRQKQKESDEKLTVNPYVEAFSTGTHSRHTPIYLIFQQAIPTDKMITDEIHRYVRIYPEVTGKFTFENNRTLVFTPTDEFARDTEYEVEADLSHWFEAKGATSRFRFRFTTYPLQLHAELKSLECAQQEGHYTVRCAFYTPDRELPETVESLIRCSETVKQHWQHTPDGRRHELQLVGVEGKSRCLRLAVAPNKWQLPEETLLSVEIPDSNRFALYRIDSHEEPERVVEVTFTQPLDSKQTMQGLAWIDSNQSTAIEVEGNKLRLFPDVKCEGVVHLHLSREIRSNCGQLLAENVVKQLELGREKPAVRWIGTGVIMPQSDQLNIPFQSIYLRGVVVRVIKIFEQNMGHFLQMNDLDGMGELMRVGRLVARKTLFFDDAEKDGFVRWRTDVINLKELIDPEPGAIYRVELAFNRDLSAWPCLDYTPIPKEQIVSQDPIRFQEEVNRFDEGGYYFTSGNLDWSRYRYQERNDPCKESYYFNTNIGKNVLTTNLGLMAARGVGKEMTVWVHHLQTTDPERDVEVVAYNYQRQELARGKTDGNGQVRLILKESRPFYLVASAGKQRSYLRVDDGSALSVSSFDVAGEEVQQGIKGFIYGERGVWRPGDTLHIGFMLHDREQQLPVNHPVILELTNPLGQIYSRQIQQKSAMGLYAFHLPTDLDAPTGAWRIDVRVGGATFTKRVRLETIKPNRLKIQLKLPEQRLIRGRSLDAPLHVEWLQGSVARRLKYDIQGTFVATPTVFDGYAGYLFDDPSKPFSSETSQFYTGQTDERGNALIKARFEVGTTAPGMLLGHLVTRVYEESGEFSLDANRLLYSPYNRYVGIHSPQVDEQPLPTGSASYYKVVSVNPQGIPQVHTDLEVNIYKVEWHWWWSSDNGSLANYVSNNYNKPIKTFLLRTDGRGAAIFPLQINDDEWGSYFIQVKDLKSKHSTGVMSYYDWPSQEGRRDMDGATSAQMLRFKTDRSTYQPGEKLRVTFPSFSGSRAILRIENGTRLLSTVEQTCKKGETTVTIPVTAEMQPNAYLHITLLQPHGSTANDLPIRMYGVVPFTVHSPKSHLYPMIQVATEVKPEQPYQVTVSEKEGRPMAYTLAVVDEGLLDLTRFQTPDPWKAFNAREALGVNSWDLYNHIVGAYSGRIEQLFSIGGDEALNRGPKATVNRFKPVVQFLGPFTLEKGEKRHHMLTMPNYYGRVRVMVVAGDGKAYGQSEQRVWVRKPVMLLGTMPRVIGVGEEMDVPASVFATEKGIGSISVSIQCSPQLEVVGASTRTVKLTEIGDQLVRFRVRAKSKQAGVGTVKLIAKGKGGQSFYIGEIQIRSLERKQVKVTSVTLDAGMQCEEAVPLFGQSGSNRLMLELSTVQPIQLTQRLENLLNYPHGCVEQIVSKAFPLLYISQLTSLSIEQQQRAEQIVKEVIRRLLAYQTVEGGLAYWPGHSSTHAWGSVYAAHFLLEAERKGYAVSSAFRQTLLQSLSRQSRHWKSMTTYGAASEELTQAYRLWILSFAQIPEVGAMNRLKENAELLPMSRWLLASAYASIARFDVSERLVKQTTLIHSQYDESDRTFGSDLRDQALRLFTLCQLQRGEEALQLANKISEVLASDNWLNTQETAFSLIALAYYYNQYGIASPVSFRYHCGAKQQEITTSSYIWSDTLSSGQLHSVPSITLKNQGKSTLFARLITEGVVTDGREKAYSHGLQLAVSYMDQQGHPLDITSLESGTHVVAVVTVKNSSSRAYDHLVLTELFPSGWEILNSRYLHGAVVDSTSQVRGLSYQDIRDDRVYSYIDYLPAGKELSLRFHLCAVYAGRYQLPPVYVESMYDQTIRANTAGKEVIVR